MSASVQAGLLLAAVGISGCAGPLSALDPSGRSARSIAGLWWVMLAGAAVLFAMVLILFCMVIWRPGWGSRVSPMRWIVLGGLVLPAVILIPLICYALLAGERLLPLPALAPVRIEAIAQQWRWTFRYPDQGGLEMENVLHIPAGVPVDIVVTSKDVVHAFWIPRLAGKIDAVPGHETRLRIQADQPGQYAGQCNQFCGIGHAEMHFAVVVDRPEDFSAAVKSAATAAEVKK
ncbi:cytochrome c oxidase subunit II [Paraburkholderia sp. CNPSo 3076]|uniref:cytochrome c oxidase subunit II n=1 Tax=Paraburkholderia sp. CNPSo 3076 TaxID=2940936 RepID=UPI00224F7340|nr:cytochrome c oxidase subunit II [Paraburkholderia sp. CNPSo 3076]MCX5540697.1 cytochrome c oxidase subunit II [Paraburkholderia sp. CNPSo 3076]